ncbi:hypothetical protein PtB15_9B106 [Puccinia triticina]|nr:hypothetical protein PtB15_9B106 [Puccinia triticina]
MPRDWALALKLKASPTARHLWTFHHFDLSKLKPRIDSSRAEVPPCDTRAKQTTPKPFKQTPSQPTGNRFARDADILANAVNKDEICR